MYELQAKHRKELKALEGEKRAAVKKAKGTKGKKAKEALATLEEEYATKLKDMQDRHQQELAALEGDDGEATTETPPTESDPTKQQEQEEDDPGKAARERKQAKARRKREAQRQKQKELEEEQARDLAGPSARSQELDILKTKLDPLKLKIETVASDGHCLYRAVAVQCDDGTEYPQVREMCGASLEKHQEEFAPFIEYTDDAPTFEAYVERVRNSADWGGHVELRALSLALERPIIVYSAQQVDPLRIHMEYEDKEPILLSYHLHYYSLGEHYNCVVKMSEVDEE